MTQEGPPSGPHLSDPGSDGRDLSAQLAAERAGTTYWREVARQRREDAARIQHRPLVRAAVAVDRRTRGAQRSLGRVTDAVRRTADRASLALGGLGQRHRGPHPARASDPVSDGRRDPRDRRSVVLLHLGAPPSLPPDRTVSLVAVHEGDADGAVGLARLDRAVSDSDAELVCLLGPGSEPLSPAWLDHLTAPIRGVTTATIPLTVHPARRWTSATPHDRRVRNAGLDVELDPVGSPVARAREAGRSPAQVLDAKDVISASASGVAVDRRAWSAAGGLSPGGSIGLDVAIVDLSRRLRRDGGRIELVREALVEDARPVTRRSELAGPISDDDPGWRTLVEAEGAALLPRVDAHRPATVVITTATPSRKMASRSGDWHFAQGFASALRRAGHPVLVQTHDEADSLAGRACDLHVVLRGLEPVRRTAGQRHVIWVISHPEALDPEECDQADLVVVASERFAAHLATLTTTPVAVLHQATDPHRFRPRPVDPAHQHPITVVAGTRGVDRASVSDALAAGLHPTVYGPGWAGRLDARHLAGEYVTPDDLPVVYSSADLVLNDHWDTMRRWGFVSNRILDVLACGTPIVSDHMPEIQTLFDDLVPTWSNPTELRAVVAEVQGAPERTARRTAEARDRVLTGHTFDHRVVELRSLLTAPGTCAGKASR